MHDVLIIGGGVIGLSLAWDLAKHGRSVHLIDQSEPGREASNDGPAVFRGSPGKAPGYVTPPRTEEGKSRSSGPVVYRGGKPTSMPTIITPPKAEGGKPRGNGTTVNRSSRAETPGFSSDTRATGGKQNGSVYRGGSRSATSTSQPRPAAGKSGQVYNQPTRASTSVPAKASSSRSRSSGGGASATVKSSGDGAKANRKGRN